MESFIENTDAGIYCSVGNFYIDPTREVDRAIVTHAHSDHARYGCRRYLATASSQQLLRMRMNADAEFQFQDFGESVNVGGVKISFHPAGHILGSAQVRLEYRGYVVVVTGDYKLGEDSTCRAWSPVSCHLLVTESTFGLPVYRWQPQSEIFRAINDWWRKNRDEEKCSVLYGYAVGKSQRLLAGLDVETGLIFTHGAVEKGVGAYRESGVHLPRTKYVGDADVKQDYRGAMVLAVPSAHRTPWLKRFGKISTAMASGWMMVRGSRRRRSVDQGFALSDHVDWPSLLTAIEMCNPEEVWVTHGYSEVVARYLNETGRNAKVIGRRSRSDEEEDQTE